MKSFRRLLPALAFFAGVSVFAAEAPPVTHDYFATDAIDFHTIVTAPPAEDSIPGQADHEVAIDLDANRTPDQAALAKHYEKLSVFTLLTDVLGDWCTPANLPRTKAVFDQAFHESRPIIEAAKSNWNRQRPYVYNPTLHPAVEKPENTSYPSGHSYMSALAAVLLTNALPEHAADWEKQAALVRWSRLVGGAHYPNDVMAGKLLGEAVGREMLKSPLLLQALKEVRAEIDARAPKKTG